MTISVFDLLKIGIGPSSSHTVGPMKAMRMFLDALHEEKIFDQIHKVEVELFGSLGSTGKGHGSDKAIILGLLGETPENVDVEKIPAFLEEIHDSQKLNLDRERPITFNPLEDIVMHRNKVLDFHSNAMQAKAYNSDGALLQERFYYSVGGGFVLGEDSSGQSTLVEDSTPQPYPFSSADELLKLCKNTGLRISTIMMKNECVWRTQKEIEEKLLHLWSTMDQCIQNGCRNEGILPGGLNVKRRAPALYHKLKTTTVADTLNELDWLNLYAIAINEENAAGGRVVTAPTNGAAGIVPAVLKYAVDFRKCNSPDLIINYLLTAAAIGILFKKNASISGAEVGCQGEVGSACSMAAAGFAELQGGTPEQVENAAEIALEHNLGLTCDPIGGLVQIPCIERNAIATTKAINAVRLSLQGDGTHFVSLDKAIITMRETGKDMLDKYKETARGGLAVNVIEC